jgi:hypothetical protein
MSLRPFLPTTRQTIWLAAVAVTALGCGLWLRYRVIELSSVGIACEAGAGTALCALRLTAITLFGHSAFGIVALVVAVLHVMRPSVLLLAPGLVAAGLGIVLYNVGLSSLAVVLFILAFARPQASAA